MRNWLNRILRTIDPRELGPLDFPIVSGNVSLYNETNGTGILPTPTIGGVGLIDDWSKMARIAFAAENESVLLVGAPAQWGMHLGQSIYMRDLFGRTDGPAKKLPRHVRSCDSITQDCGPPWRDGLFLDRMKGLHLSNESLMLS